MGNKPARLANDRLNSSYVELPVPGNSEGLILAAWCNAPKFHMAATLRDDLETEGLQDSDDFWTG